MSRQSNRRTYRLDEATTCGRCKAPIGAGEPHYRDATKTAMHKQCVRLHIHPAVRPWASRYLQDDPVGQPCEGCGDVIAAGEAVVHVATRAWHSECRVAMR